MKIEKRLISKNYSKGVTITPQFIVIHETDNTDVGANADAHFRYWNTNDNASSSVHFVVDDTKVIQLLELNQKAWHVGDNKGYSNITNNNSISIEICVNSDGDYTKARQNCIELVKYLLGVTGLTTDKVVRHNDASGKHCPRKMLDDPQLWTDFKAQVQVPSELTSINDIVWELANRGIISDKDLWLDKLKQDSNSYWLARKMVKYFQIKNI